MIASTLAFSLIASVLVAILGRREPRLSGVALGLLLAMPWLTLLPKWDILPPTPGARPSVSLTPILLVGTFLLLLRLAFSMHALARLKKSSLLLKSLVLANGLQVELRTCSTLSGPVAAGVFRPVILVPTAWNAWTPTQQQIVLAHELAHLQRRDPLWRLIAEMTCAVHWFNPLVWWLARCQRHAAEFACDASVVHSGIPARTYASVLCDLAAARPTPAPAVALAESSLLHGRVQRLLHPPHGVPPRATALLLAAIGLLAVGIAIIRPAEPLASQIAPEATLRLAADPFPGN
ncbi:beta-lactamase regulating signal transducer with metallopeptidase domain [Haloferula luteola]|uniref:Beta-lactamase regulating signal transducer with metallopeptidase domain n=1 Tax=Haloferula luteola TaxID=595692 RepID=A0A840VF19_9BACT|nr:M56 family metallopeptidase [Haloferula luteola]MBB5351411.1 beta-lactamase regulating signal transducer with metallopeptidase domain [Haloferula luteola]